MKRLALLALLWIASSTAMADRIKDLASVATVRQNQLIGYGLVVGLNGTGDTLNNSPFTQQSLTGMLERLGWAALPRSPPIPTPDGPSNG